MKGAELRTWQTSSHCVHSPAWHRKGNHPQSLAKSRWATASSRAFWNTSRFCLSNSDFSVAGETFCGPIWKGATKGLPYLDRLAPLRAQTTVAGLLSWYWVLSCEDVRWLQNTVRVRGRKSEELQEHSEDSVATGFPGLTVSDSRRTISEEWVCCS